MKPSFIFRPIKKDAIKPIFLKDYSASLNKYMKCVGEKIWISDGSHIKLKKYETRLFHYVRCYDFGYGNILCPEGKISQCIEKIIADYQYVACLINTHSGTFINLYKIPLEDERRWRCEVNLFQCYSPLFSIGIGPIRSRIWFEQTCLLYQVKDTVHCHSLIDYETFSIQRITENSTINRTNNNINDLYSHNKRIIHIQENNVHTLILKPYKWNTNRKYPAITVCLGGPFVEIPDLTDISSIYNFFAANGYFVIIPLRRGIIGLGNKWESALEGHYGKVDVEDVITGTQTAILHTSFINADKIGLYGASYGGYTATLIAGMKKPLCNFKAIVSVCGLSDTKQYAKEGQGDHITVKTAYNNSPSPVKSIANRTIPMLLIHTIDDETVWFGQSVRLYNIARLSSAPVQLLLAEGPHSMNIVARPFIESSIIKFFKKNL